MAKVILLHFGPTHFGYVHVAHSYCAAQGGEGLTINGTFFSRGFLTETIWALRDMKRAEWRVVEAPDYSHLRWLRRKGVMVQGYINPMLHLTEDHPALAPVDHAAPLLETMLELRLTPGQSATVQLKWLASSEDEPALGRLIEGFNTPRALKMSLGQLPAPSFVVPQLPFAPPWDQVRRLVKTQLK